MATRDTRASDQSLRRLTDSLADRYQVERELGAGGMARVYLARDLKHGRQVAIKTMHPELAETLGKERFLREIQLLARLQHPHILGLVDSGDAGGVLYYVMPYLDAGSLRGRMDREGELPLEDALQVLREVAGALEHAHAAGIVHRDIKPENVLFSAGHAQVADFGIARLVGEAGPGTSLTTLGMTIGTPRYMAPEQAAADPKMDHRADIYSFGVMAYESLAGVPPFSASSPAQLAAMHINEEPIPLSKRRPSVGPEVEAVVMRCLSKRPADRWQTARELKTALDRAATEERRAAPLPRRGGTVVSRMPITETVARRIDRRTFDPRLIGDALEYLDNQTESDVLVFLLNAVWLDGSDFEAHLRTFPYRCIAPTLLGFEPQPRHRIPLSFADHIALVSELVHHLTRESEPSLVIVIGFSASGDLALKLPASMPESARPIDGLLALGPNQGIETCFVSRVMARLDSNDPARLLEAFRTITAAASSLDDWMLLNGYIGRIMARFRENVAPLRSLGKDIVEPFERLGPSAFAEMYRDATARVRMVRCIFEDSEICNRLLKQALLDHMDTGVLGDRHRDGALLIESTPSHFELLQPERMARHLNAMVEELREVQR